MPLLGGKYEEQLPGAQTADPRDSVLRVVDASVFPSIPGFFIVVPIYMVSEKATDVLLEDIGERRRDI